MSSSSPHLNLRKGRAKSVASPRRSGSLALGTGKHGTPSLSTSPGGAGRTPASPRNGSASPRKPHASPSPRPSPGGSALAASPRLSRSPSRQQQEASSSPLQKRRDTARYITIDMLRRVSREENLALVTSINLTFSPQEHMKIKYIENLESLRNLRSLNLSGNAIEKIEKIHSLTMLVELNLAGNCISRVEGLDTLSNLALLDLSGNRISRLPPADAMRKLVRLRDLRLAGNHLSTLHDISRLKACTNLTNLTIGNNPLTEISHWWLFAVYHLRTLETLDERAIADDDQKNAKDRFSVEEVSYLEEELAKQDEYIVLLEGELAATTEQCQERQQQLAAECTQKTSLQRSVADLEQELSATTELLNSKSAELARACRKHYELEQELAFGKLDSKFDPHTWTKRLAADDSDEELESPYLGRARFKPSSYANERDLRASPQQATLHSAPPPVRTDRSPARTPSGMLTPPQRATVMPDGAGGDGGGGGGERNGRDFAALQAALEERNEEYEKVVNLARNLGGELRGTREDLGNAQQELNALRECEREREQQQLEREQQEREREQQEREREQQEREREQQERAALEEQQALTDQHRDSVVELQGNNLALEQTLDEAHSQLQELDALRQEHELELQEMRDQLAMKSQHITSLEASFAPHQHRQSLDGSLLVRLSHLVGALEQKTRQLTTEVSQPEESPRARLVSSALAEFMESNTPYGAHNGFADGDGGGDNGGGATVEVSTMTQGADEPTAELGRQLTSLMEALAEEAELAQHRHAQASAECRHLKQELAAAHEHTATCQAEANAELEQVHREVAELQELVAAERQRNSQQLQVANAASESLRRALELEKARADDAERVLQEELGAQHAYLNDQDQRLRERLHTTEQALAAARQQLAAQQLSLDEQAADMEHLAAEKSMLNDRITQLQSELRSAAGALATARGRLSGQQSSHADLAAELDRMAADSDVLNATAARLQTELSQSEAERRRLEAELKAAQRRADDAEQALQEEVSTQESYLKDQDQRVRDKLTKSEAAQKRLEKELQSALARASEAERVLQEELGAQQTYVNDQEQRMKEKLRTAEHAQVASEDRLATQQSSLDELGDQIDRMAAEKDALDELVERLQTELVQCGADKKGLEAELKAAQSLADSANGALQDELTQQQELLKQYRQQLETKMKAALDQATYLQQQLSNEEDARNQLEQAFVRVQQNRDALGASAQQMQEEIHRLRAQLATIESQLRDAEVARAQSHVPPSDVAELSKAVAEQQRLVARLQQLLPGQSSAAAATATQTGGPVATPPPGAERPDGERSARLDDILLELGRLRQALEHQHGILQDIHRSDEGTSSASESHIHIHTDSPTSVRHPHQQQQQQHRATQTPGKQRKAGSATVTSTPQHRRTSAAAAAVGSGPELLSPRPDSGDDAGNDSHVDVVLMPSQSQRHRRQQQDDDPRHSHRDPTSTSAQRTQSPVTTQHWPASTVTYSHVSVGGQRVDPQPSYSHAFEPPAPPVASSAAANASYDFPSHLRLPTSADTSASLPEPLRSSQRMHQHPATSTTRLGPSNPALHPQQQQQQQQADGLYSALHWQAHATPRQSPSDSFAQQPSPVHPAAAAAAESTRLFDISYRHADGSPVATPGKMTYGELAPRVRGGVGVGGGDTHVHVHPAGAAFDASVLGAHPTVPTGVYHHPHPPPPHSSGLFCNVVEHQTLEDQVSQLQNSLAQSRRTARETRELLRTASSSKSADDSAQLHSLYISRQKELDQLEEQLTQEHTELRTTQELTNAAKLKLHEARESTVATELRLTELQRVTTDLSARQRLAQDELAELQTTIAEGRQQKMQGIGVHEEQLSSLAGRLREYEHKANVAETELTRSRHEHAAVEDRLSASRADLQGSEQQLEAVRRSLEQTQSEMTAARAAARQEQARLQQLRDEASRCGGDLSAARRQLDEVQSLTDSSRVRAVAGQEAAQSAKLEELQRETSKAEQRVDELHTRGQQLEQTTRLRHQALASEQQQIESSLANLQHQHGEVADALREARGQRLSEEKRLATCRQQVQQVEQESEVVRNRIDRMERDNSTAAAESSRYQQSLASAITQVREAESLLARKRDEEELLQKRAAELRREVQESEGSLPIAHQNHTAVVHRTELAQSTLQSLLERCRVTEEQLAATRLRLAEETDRLALLRDQQSATQKVQTELQLQCEKLRSMTESLQGDQTRLSAIAASNDSDVIRELKARLKSVTTLCEQRESEFSTLQQRYSSQREEKKRIKETLRSERSRKRDVEQQLSSHQHFVDNGLQRMRQDIHGLHEEVVAGKKSMDASGSATFRATPTRNASSHALSALDDSSGSDRLAAQLATPPNLSVDQDRTRQQQCELLQTKLDAQLAHHEGALRSEQARTEGSIGVLNSQVSSLERSIQHQLSLASTLDKAPTATRAPERRVLTTSIASSAGRIPALVTTSSSFSGNSSLLNFFSTSGVVKAAALTPAVGRSRATATLATSPLSSSSSSSPSSSPSRPHSAAATGTGSRQRLHQSPLTSSGPPATATCTAGKVDYETMMRRPQTGRSAAVADVSSTSSVSAELTVPASVSDHQQYSSLSRAHSGANSHAVYSPLDYSNLTL